MTGILAMATSYDAFSEQLVDKHMCTDTCPCFTREEWLLTEEDVKVRRIDPEFTYSNLNEQILNLHGRTMENRTGKV